MRTLIYVPIIHSGPDMGSMAEELTKKGIDEFGGDFWEKHVDTVNKYWEVIEHCCDSIDFNGKQVTIYQDGMVADGEIALKIVEDSVKAGSKNYEIVAKLLKKGGAIVKTEELNLVRREVDMLKSMPTTGSIIVKIFRLLLFKWRRAKLLKQRDRYIAKRIDDTLRPEEVGIIFIGAFHNVIDKLPHDVNVVEFKKVQKVKLYQQILPFHSRKQELFEELSDYLKSSSTL